MRGSEPALSEVEGVNFNQASRIQRLRRKSVRGSTGSPRTDHDTIDIDHFAVRPECVEGQTAKFHTVSHAGGVGCYCRLAPLEMKER